MRIGAVRTAAKRQLKRSKSFELFIIDRFFYIITHRAKRKVSFYFYGGKELNETGASGFAVGRRRSPIEKLTQPQCVEQRPANPPVYDQAISAFKSRDGATGSWSDNSIDYAVIITELAKAPLHGCNQ